VSELKALIAGFAKPGVLDTILLRPDRLVAPVYVDHVQVTEDGLVGDHASQGKRAVTLIQAEHLSVIGAMLGKPAIEADTLRRNLVVSGLNLAALKGRHLKIGEVVLQITTICAPCSRMEAALGQGGYSAMRGHGGWCATVRKAGRIGLGDSVEPAPDLAD
jgi:MOSC domain-containing protein YiiM